MKIEKYFILNKYLLSLLGVDDFKKLQQKLKDTQEDIDSDGRSYFINILISAFPNRKISERELLRYDLNIQEYLRKINYRRGNISLKYFQYLAILFTEIFLDNFKNRKLEFIYELNDFLKKYDDENVKELISQLTEDDLRKIAFYMATGSGKTIIAHINYYQFFNYQLFSPDSILFITPNEGLSKQHYEELTKSGIPAKLYSGSLSSNGLKANNEILVIEITKFVEEKKGGGLTLSIDTFEGRNLIFVDEGHKGKKSEEQKWAKLRDKLAENGFVFEYSATFGQILNEENKEILKEYSKSIIFDYSYKYFYLDGYGKNFYVANVDEAKISKERFQKTMFVANLLSFYEQLLVYEENKNLVKTYNIEKPLWIFVGTTVTNKKKSTNLVKEEKETLTDVIQIIKFIEKIIKEKEWLKKMIEDILTGNTGLVNYDGLDIFSNKFEYLKNKQFSIEDLYKKIFNGQGKFYVNELKNAEGEFGLKLSENSYFGVINIGDVLQFKKQLKNLGFEVGQDVISNSLFENIKEENSTINILIGAKKFIEGWDTWRVSSMGLLNIGKSQGPQIIQLFGRGVRLKGKNMSLKRSEENSLISYLETLNIYSINADYLKKFLDAIRKEEVEFETIEIPIKLQHENKWKELTILHKNENKKFEEELLKLEDDDKIFFTIDLLPKISIYETKERKEEKGEVVGIKSDEVKLKIEPISFPQDKINLINWDRVWQEVYQCKSLKKYWNLIIDQNVIKNLLTSERFKIKINILDYKNKEDIKKLENIAILIIKKYIEKFYEKAAKKFETANLAYKKVSDKKEQLLLPFIIADDKKSYVIQIRKEKKELINKIKNLLKDLTKLYQEETEELPRVYFDNHLFLPILIKSEKIDKMTPEGLVESEKKFIYDLKNYLKQNQKKIKDYEFYILRNFSRLGIGFKLQWSQFYPDFIMWIKKIDDKERQIIVFIEPHGLEHSKGLSDEKVQFKTLIKNIEKELNNKEKRDFKLEYFLLSPTKYEDLQKGTVNFPSIKQFEENHVLFMENKENFLWPETLFKMVGLF